MWSIELRGTDLKVLENIYSYCVYFIFQSFRVRWMVEAKHRAVQKKITMEGEVRIMKITNEQVTKQTWGVHQVSFIVLWIWSFIKQGGLI